MMRIEKELLLIYKDVFCFVMSRINDLECSKDITQSVMETAILKGNTLRRKSSLKSWVMQIASNKINAYYNDLKKINKRVFYIEHEYEEQEINVENIVDIKENILERIVKEEDFANVMLAMSNLEKKYQEVLRLNYICGYNLIEVSEIMNVNVNTVRTWASRGLIKLKEEFDKIDSGEWP